MAFLLINGTAQAVNYTDCSSGCFVNGTDSTHTWDSWIATATGCSSSPAGNDTTGTGSCSAPWATISGARGGGTIYTADASNNANIYVANGTYNETTATVNGPNAGHVWNWYFEAEQTTVSLPTSVEYLFRSQSTGTEKFIGGCMGLSKCTAFQFPANYNYAGGSFWYSNSNGTFFASDVEIDGSQDNLGKGALFHTYTGSGTFYCVGCLINQLARTSDFTYGNAYVLSSYIVNNAGMRLGGGSYETRFINDTIYQNSSNTQTPIALSNGTLATAALYNNLYVSDAAIGTLEYFWNFAATGQTITNFLRGQNLSWKTASIGTKWTNTNSWIIGFDGSGTWGNDVVSFDPGWTGSATSPTVSSSSFTIGRGNASVLTNIGPLSYNLTRDYANQSLGGSPPIGCYVGGTTTQHLTQTPKLILPAGDSWVYEALSGGQTKAWSLLLNDPAFAASNGWTWVYLHNYATAPTPTAGTPSSSGTSTDSFAGLPGVLLARWMPMVTHLTKLYSPSNIGWGSGGANDMTNNGECTSSGVPDTCCTGYQAGSCTGYSAAAIADMNNRLADWVAGLYAPGDQPTIIGMGVGPRDGLGDTDGALYGSNYTALSRSAEAIIAPYWQGKGYSFIPWMTDAGSYGMTNAYVVGQGGCVSGTCDSACSAAHCSGTCTGCGSYNCLEDFCAHPSTAGWIYQSGLVKQAIMQDPVQITISASPSAFSIDQGTAGTSTIQTTVLGDPNNAVALSASGLPTGITAAFSPATIPAPGAGSSTMTITVASSVAAGTYPFTVGASGGVNNTAAVTAVVIQTYTVTSSVANGTGGTVTPASDTMATGSNVTLTMTPSTGYGLASLTDNGANVTSAVSNGSYTITDITANHTVVATFANTFTITAQESGSGTIADSSGSVSYGGSVTFTMTPAAGYSLTSLTDNGVPVPPAQGPSGTFTYTVTDATANQTVDATFSPVVAPVPALGEWGFIGAALGMLWLGLRRRRKQQD
jgi:hypothetical protein